MDPHNASSPWSPRLLISRNVILFCSIAQLRLGVGKHVIVACELHLESHFVLLRHARVLSPNGSPLSAFWRRWGPQRHLKCPKAGPSGAQALQKIGQRRPFGGHLPPPTIPTRRPLWLVSLTVQMICCWSSKWWPPTLKVGPPTTHLGPFGETKWMRHTLSSPKPL